MKNLLALVFVCSISTTLFAQIDYESDIQPIFSNNCVSCHGGTSGVTLSNYSAAINSIGAQYEVRVITPGNADNSPLVDKIEDNPQFGDRMPQGGQLSSDEINKIKQWINEGANEQVTTSNEDEIVSPNEFKLLGNYPNPFNPTTTIQFQLPMTADFKITVYNANGQLIRSVNSRGGAGLKQKSIDLTDQSSGVYFYRIRAFVNGTFDLVGTGKMTLIK